MCSYEFLLVFLLQDELKRLFSGVLDNDKALFTNLKELNNELKISVIKQLAKESATFKETQENSRK